MTDVQKEYNRLRNNLSRQIRSMEKRGFFFLDGSPLPERPKKVTPGSVNRLKKIQKDLYNKARFFDPITGKETSGVRGQDIERRRARRRQWSKRKKKDEIPVYTMYNTILDDLENRKDGIYTRSQGSKKVIWVSFSSNIWRCISALKQRYKTDPEKYEEYLSVYEEEVIGALEKSRILEDFTSDISEIVEAYSVLFNIISGYTPDTPMEPDPETENADLMTPLPFF